MNFALNEEQKLLRDTLSRWLAERHGFEQRRKTVRNREGFSREHWHEFAALGWLSAGLPEEAGGLGGGAVDHMLVAECLGRALWGGPWLDSVVMGADLLAGCAGDEARGLLGEVLEGRALLACALLEAQSAWNVLDVATTARRETGGWRLAGRKTFVAWAASADHLLVPARIDGGRDDRAGLCLFLLPCSTRGIRRRDWRSVDEQRMAEVLLEDVKVDDSALLAGAAGDDTAAVLLERAFDRGAAALVAEVAGIQWALHETTLSYLKTRRQFDVPLASFQALQHRMVDIYTECEMVTSLAWAAAYAAEGADSVARARTVSAASSRAGRAALRVGREAIQLHGGMGMTDELPVGHWLKRLTVINTTLGDPAWHAARFRTLSDDPVPAAP